MSLSLGGLGNHLLCTWHWINYLILSYVNYVTEKVSSWWLAQSRSIYCSFLFSSKLMHKYLQFSQSCHKWVIIWKLKQLRICQEGKRYGMNVWLLFHVEDTGHITIEHLLTNLLFLLFSLFYCPLFPIVLLQLCLLLYFLFFLFFLFCHTNKKWNYDTNKWYKSIQNHNEYTKLQYNIELLKIERKDASDKEPTISGERELKNLGPWKNTENCQIFVLHNGRWKEIACLVYTK